MRPTRLNFRSPSERTAELKNFSQTHLGTDLNFLKRTMNQSGSILPKEQRFKDKPLFDKGTGQTCFLGPGSYNDHQAFIDLHRHSCSSKIVRFLLVTLKNVFTDGPDCPAFARGWLTMLYHGRRLDKV